MLKKILKVFYNLILIFSITFLFVVNVETIKNTSLITNFLERQIEELKESNNNLLDNDMTLERDIQESNRNLDKNLALFKNDVQESNRNIDKNLIFLENNIDKKLTSLERDIYRIKETISEPNINKLLNGSVFVNDIRGSGSGTVIKKTKDSMYILTCAHVVNDIYNLQEKISIAGTLGYSKTGKYDKISGSILYTYTVIKFDKENDLALIKTGNVDNSLEVIPIADFTPDKGDVIYSVGNPLGFYRTISKGILSNKSNGFYITDCTTTFGNSGGGIFNKNGELIGVPSQVEGYGNEETFVPESSLGFSVSLERIKEFLKDVNW